MRLHVVSLPHTQTTREYDRCAYTTKVRRFCDMMHGHFPVTLYAGDENEAACNELVSLTSRGLQASLGFHGPDDYLGIDWNPAGPLFGLWNEWLRVALSERYQPGDLVCLITGQPHATLRYSLPQATFVEFGIGYEGVCFDHLVFESHAWRHCVYGWRHGAAAADADPRHAVIPNYFPPEEFPLVRESSHYVLYLGRLTQRKGWRIAQKAAQFASLPFVVAGPEGDDPFTGYGDYLGTVGGAERAELLGNAGVVACPTRYIEPFCGVHVEAMLCGTPVVASDWGVFTETLEPAQRCRRDEDWPLALAKTIDDSTPGAREHTSARAAARFSLDAVRPLYVDYLGGIV